MREETGLLRGANPRSTQAKPQGAPPTRGARRPKSGSSTRAERWTVTPATSSTPGARARRTREQQWATTLDGADATTAARTAPRRRSPQGPVCSAGRSARRRSPNASANPRPSSSTVGDNPRGPLKQRGNPHLKPATRPKHNLPNPAGNGPRRRNPDGPSRRPS
jgi:hypothetical protein